MSDLRCKAAHVCIARALTLFWIASTAVSAAACTDDSNVNDAGAAQSDAGAQDASNTNDASDASDAGDDAAALPSALFSDFTINVDTADTEADTSFTGLLGRFYDREPALPTPVELDMELGDCELWVPVNPFCEERCTDGATCTANSVCTPRALPLSVGTITLHGVGDDLELEPTPPTFPYQPRTQLPYPPCEEGSDVSILADDFNVHAPCIAPLIVESTEPVRLRADEAAEVSWDPPGEADISRMQLVVDLSHHGGMKGKIHCDVPDTGAFSIPAPMVTRLLELGVAAAATVLFSRVSTGTSTDYPGVSLSMSASVERPVDTGIPSCFGGEPCPDELECDMVTYTCK